MLHIAIDLDDCVLDFVGNLVAVINREYDAGLSTSDISEWELAPKLEPILGEDWWEWWRRRDWLWSKADAVPGAIGALEELRRRGHYLEIVTAKPRWAEACTWQWLGKWRPPVHRVTIIDLDTPKWSVTEASILVDDKTTTVKGWVASNPDRKAFLFNRTHNCRDTDLPDRAIRVYGWQDVLRRLP